MKRWITLVVVLALVGGGWYALRRFRDAAMRARETPVPTQAASVRDITETVDIVGEVASALDIEVKSEISGRITTLHVMDGNTVTQGELLVSLDRSELESQREEVALSIESANLRGEQARSDFRRVAALYRNKLVPEEEYEDAQTAQALAENNLKLERAKLQTLDQQLVKTKIYAPINGMVVECDAKEGQVIVGASSVSMGTVLMKIAQLDKLVVKSSVNEVDAVRLVRGMPATVTFDSIPGVSLSARVDRIAPSATTAEGQDRRESVRLFPVEVTCAEADPRVKLGISANVAIPTAATQNVVAVSISGVFNEKDGKVVYVKTDSGFDKRPVTIGLNDLSWVEITSGLSSGEVVALSYPPQFAEERMRSTP